MKRKREVKRMKINKAKLCLTKHNVLHGLTRREHPKTLFKCFSKIDLVKYQVKNN